MSPRIGVRGQCVLLGACLALGWPAGIAARAAVGPKEVEAERIVLKDKNGKVRMVLGVNAQGNPEITMQDAEGKDRVRVGLKEDSSPSVTLSDKSGNARIQLSVAENGVASATIADPNGKSRIGMVVGQSGRPIVNLTEADGKERVALHVNEHGNAIVRVRDGADKIRSAMVATPDGASTLNLIDQNGNERVALHFNPVGLGSLQLSDDQRKVRLVLAQVANVTDMGLYDQHGKLRQLVWIDNNGSPKHELHDADGKVRLRSDMGPEGDVQMTMFRKDGKTLSSMATRGNHAGQTYFGEDGNPRINFGLNSDGVPGLLFHDGRVRGARMTLRVLPHANGTPIISLMDKRGADRIGLVMTNDDSPMLGLRDSAGVDRAIVGMQNEYPIMVLNGRGGNERAAFAVAPADESAFLRLRNPNGQREFTAP